MTKKSFSKKTDINKVTTVIRPNQKVLKNVLLCGFDVPEELKVSHGELGSNLHGAELQQRDLTLSEEILGVLV